ncbi:MAG TPA: TrmH family RNA methyltransferase [Rubrobacter sp.]|nr:TrmH family RNA methyltransferase [Rubrobacter sp.]
MQVFLDAPQDFEHVCVISRTLEVFGVRRCHVHDTNGLIRPRYGKSRTRRLKKVSAGAFFRVSFERVEDPVKFLTAFRGRKVATVPDRQAALLTAFRFRPGDLLVFGSEGRGVSPEVLSLCDERVTIPQRGATQSLNLGVAVGIVLFETLRQRANPDATEPG